MVKHQKRASSVDKWGSVLSCPSVDHSYHRYQFISLIKISYRDNVVLNIIIIHFFFFNRLRGLKHFQIRFFKGVKLTNRIDYSNFRISDLFLCYCKIIKFLLLIF